MNSTYSFNWDSGAQVTNGTTASARQTVCDTYTFTQPGAYTVLLNADDGTGQASATITVNVTSPCGDGVLQAGETCDDGNTSGGDGCSSTCGVEIGYMCAVSADAIANGCLRA